MRSEKEVKTDLSYITNSSRDSQEVLERFQQFFSREIDGLAFFSHQRRDSTRHLDDASVSRLLDSRHYPLRCLYMVPLFPNGRDAGTLIACFAAFDTPGEILRSLTSHVAQEFEGLLARQRVHLHQEVA